MPTWADNANQDGLPYVAGDLSIANTIIHGDAHLMLVGDSILADMNGAFQSQWKVDRWSGVVLGPNNPVGQYVFPGASISSETLRTPLDPSGPANLSTSAPSGQAEFVFNHTSAPAVDSYPVVFADRFYELGLSPTVAGAAALWANTSTGNITLTPLIYANPNGVADNSVEMSVRLNSIDTPLAVVPLNGNNSSTTKLIGTSVTVPAQTWAGSNYLAADFRLAAGAAPANGSNFSLAALRISNGGPGFQLADIAFGGWKVEDFLNNQITPAANVNQFVTLTDSNVTMIQLGTNDLGVDDAATFKANLQALINRYRAANPAMKFILSTTYDVNQLDQHEVDGTLRQVAFNRDMYELAQSNSGVMFMDLYDKASEWSVLNANYLSDGRHPTVAGADYFTGLQWDLISQAAAQATPEPSSLSAFAVLAGSALLRRHRQAA